MKEKKNRFLIIHNNKDGQRVHSQEVRGGATSASLCALRTQDKLDTHAVSVYHRGIMMFGRERGDLVDDYHASIEYSPFIKGMINAAGLTGALILISIIVSTFIKSF